VRIYSECILICQIPTVQKTKKVLDN
jgi:hypothetical protein